MEGFYFFPTKEDIATRFVIALLMYGEVFTGIWLINFYYDNSVWFDSIGKHIRAMPTIWMIQCIWNVVDFLLGTSIYLFYRNSDDIMTSSTYAFDAITILFMLNVALSKLYPMIFMHLRYTLCSLIMMMTVTAISILMLSIYALNDKWDEFGYMIPFFLWNLYLVYINFNWIRVERMKASGLL